MRKTHLQGIGKVNAKAVKDLAIGDVILWNYGYRSAVLNVIFTPSGKMANVVLRSADSGKVSVRRLGSERLVGIAK